MKFFNRNRFYNNIKDTCCIYVVNHTLPHQFRKLLAQTVNEKGQSLFASFSKKNQTFINKTLPVVNFYKYVVWVSTRQNLMSESIISIMKNGFYLSLSNLKTERHDILRQQNVFDIVISILIFYLKIIYRLCRIIKILCTRIHNVPFTPLLSLNFFPRSNLLLKITTIYYNNFYSHLL